ncbi:phosphatidic acid phosphatase type 2/haloperoxidase, partial [Mycena crocata]
TIRSWWDLHNEQLVTLGLSIGGCNPVYHGRPRPDILFRCQPNPGSVDPIYELANSSVCTTRSDSYPMLGGLRFIPSGHSSLSFAGWGFLAFYVAGDLHLFDRRGYAAKAWISLVHFAAAALVVISRATDNRHYPQDVLAGSILGTVVSYFSYRQYYIDLASDVSHLPYLPRTTRDDMLSLRGRTSSRATERSNESTVLRDGHRFQGVVVWGKRIPRRNKSVT